MATARRSRRRTSWRSPRTATASVQVGEEIEASDEVVKANPSLFSEPAATVPAKKRTTKKT